jgi:hypothetical protein
LSRLPVLPSSLYYFATDKIIARQSGLLDARRFREFADIYLTGFYELVSYLRGRGLKHIAVLYPSSWAVSSRPPGMTAYAMVKSAGEILCEDMTRGWPGSRVFAPRLPPLLTDQAAAVAGLSCLPVEEVMLPLIRQVERAAIRHQTASD